MPTQYRCRSNINKNININYASFMPTQYRCRSNINKNINNINYASFMPTQYRCRSNINKNININYASLICPLNTDVGLI